MTGSNYRLIEEIRRFPLLIPYLKPPRVFTSLGRFSFFSPALSSFQAAVKMVPIKFLRKRTPCWERLPGCLRYPRTRLRWERNLSLGGQGHCGDLHRSSRHSSCPMQNTSVFINSRRCQRCESARTQVPSIERALSETTDTYVEMDLRSNKVINGHEMHPRRYISKRYTIIYKTN